MELVPQAEGGDTDVVFVGAGPGSSLVSASVVVPFETR